jgi:S-adenosylmethionine synthetase
MTRAAYERLGRILPWASLPGDYQVEIRLNPSSDDLMPLLERGARVDGVPLANDTSFAVVSLPRSPLESAVHAVERVLADAAAHGRVPIGRDVKVMGSRRGDEVRLTVAAAAIASLVPDVASYRDAKRRVHGIAEETVRTAFADAGRVLGRLDVHVNEADLDPGGAYLTLTGSSAEAGDDGQVGRGNRVGGLITPHRPMSLEAACGKNPLGHVGKLYHAIAWDACEAILALHGVEGVTVRLLSRIGRPVDRPVAAQVEVAGEPDPETLDEARHRLAAAVADWRGASQRLIEGRYELV